MIKFTIYTTENLFYLKTVKSLEWNSSSREISSLILGTLIVNALYFNEEVSNLYYDLKSPVS